MGTMYAVDGLRASLVNVVEYAEVSQQILTR